MANLISSFRAKVGQALDSGGTDHIVGHRDQDSDYAWVKLTQQLPVDTTNGSVSATWTCTVDTILGPMKCYYLDNGGPDCTLLSVDKLCKEGDFTYVHTRQGAYIKYPDTYPDTTLIESLIADEGLQFLRPYDGTEGTTMEEANAPINSYYNSYSTLSTATPSEGARTPETLRSPILSTLSTAALSKGARTSETQRRPISSYKHSSSKHSNRLKTSTLINKCSKDKSHFLGP